MCAVRLVLLTFLLLASFLDLSGSSDAYSSTYSEEDCYHVKRINLGHGDRFQGGGWVPWHTSWTVDKYEESYGIECTQFDVTNEVYFDGAGFIVKGTFDFVDGYQNLKPSQMMLGLWDDYDGVQIGGWDGYHSYNSFNRYQDTVPSDISSSSRRFWPEDTSWYSYIPTTQSLQFIERTPPFPSNSFGNGRWTACMANGAHHFGQSAEYNITFDILACPFAPTSIPTSHPTEFHVMYWGNAWNVDDFYDRYGHIPSLGHVYGKINLLETATTYEVTFESVASPTTAPISPPTFPIPTAYPTQRPSYPASSHPTPEPSLEPTMVLQPTAKPTTAYPSLSPTVAPTPGIPTLSPLYDTENPNHYNPNLDENQIKDCALYQDGDNNIWNRDDEGSFTSIGTYPYYFQVRKPIDSDAICMQTISKNVMTIKIRFVEPVFNAYLAFSSATDPIEYGFNKYFEILSSSHSSQFISTFDDTNGTAYPFKLNIGGTASGVIVFPRFLTEIESYTRDSDTTVYMRVGVLDTEAHLNLQEADPTSVPSSYPTSSNPTSQPTYDISRDKFWDINPDFLWSYPSLNITADNTYCMGKLHFSISSSSNSDDNYNNITCHQYNTNKVIPFAVIDSNAIQETLLTSNGTTNHLNTSSYYVWTNRVFSCNERVVTGTSIYNSKIIKVASSESVEGEIITFSRIQLNENMFTINYSKKYGVYLFLKASSAGFNQTVKVTPVMENWYLHIEDSHSFEICSHNDEKQIDTSKFMDSGCPPQQYPSSIRHSRGWNVVDISTIFNCQILNWYGQRSAINFMISLDSSTEGRGLIPPTYADWYDKSWSTQDDEDAPKMLFVSSDGDIVDIDIEGLL